MAWVFCLRLLNFVARLTQIAGDILVEADMVHDHAHAWNAEHFALKRHAHSAVGYVAIQVEDVILDQNAQILSAI